MPFLDGTGPIGMGPLTGRGLGLCGAGYRYGRGRRRGHSLGWRRFFGFCPWCLSYSNPTKKEEKQLLKEEAEVLKEELEEIKKRLAELEEKK